MTGHSGCFPATKYEGVRASRLGPSLQSWAKASRGPVWGATLRTNAGPCWPGHSKPILSPCPIGTALLVQWLHLRPLPVKSATSHAFSLSISLPCPCPRPRTRADSGRTGGGIDLHFPSSRFLSPPPTLFSDVLSLVTVSCTTLRVFNILNPFAAKAPAVPDKDERRPPKSANKSAGVGSRPCLFRVFVPTILSSIC